MSLPSLESFLSRTLRERLAERLPLITPEISEVEGAVLLTDIQGFTGLVEQFCQRGTEGLEQVTWALNGYFTAVVEIVYRYGGDVIAVAGDSFLCLWSAQGGLSLEESTARACQAGLAIQATLHGREAATGAHFLTRIGIGAGPVTLAYVGGVQGCWHCLLGGRAHQAAVRAESIAEPGEVILAASACGLIQNLGSFTPYADDYGRLESITLPMPPLQTLAAEVEFERLRPSVPATVLHRMELPSQEWMAEIRLLSLFLVCLPPIDNEDPCRDDLLERTHRVTYVFQQVVEHYGGTTRVDIDGKGNILLGLWGLPPYTHEDDAVRAVEAARSLRQVAPGGETLSIGVSTGRAFCGVFGSDSRRDFIVRGEVITLAARLMQAANGRFLADLETISASGQRIIHDGKLSISLKGRSQPTPVVQPRGVRQRSELGTAPMIGRDGERNKLLGSLDALLTQQSGATWLIEGEPGLGKSLLVQSIGRQALSTGAAVLVAIADPIDRRTAFAAWRPVFAAILAAEDASSVDLRIQELLAKRPDLTQLTPLISAVLPIQVMDTPLTSEMTGELRLEGTRRLLMGLLVAFAQQRSTVVIFEDAQWCDTASRTLLTDLADTSAPLFLIVTTRTQETGQSRVLGDLDDDHTIRLKTMYGDEIDKLVREELGVQNVSAQLLEWVRKRVAGNPLFAKELVRALRSTDAITIKDGRCTVADLDALLLPATVEGVITSSMNKLSPMQQLTLKVAAVIGLVFAERTVRDTHPSKDHAVDSDLASFVDNSILEEHKAMPEDGYSFRHILLRDVAYQLMPRAQRRALHRAVASWFEREHADRLHAVASVLAGHWERAEVPESTLRFLELAGEHALYSGTFEEAMENYRQALAIVDDAPSARDRVRQARLELGLGMATYFLGDYRESRRWLESAVALLDRPLPLRTWAILLATLRAALGQTRNRLLQRHAVRAGEINGGTFTSASECYRILAQIYFLQGEPAGSLAYLTLRGVNVGEKAGSSASLARSLANLGAMMSYLGLKRLSDWYGLRAVSMAEQEGQYAAGAYVRSIGSMRLAANGRAGEALESSAEALERIELLGDFNLELEVMSVRAMIAATNHHYDIADQAARRCVELARKTGSLVLGGWAALNLVDVALARADLPAAQASLAEGRALLAGFSDVASLALIARAEARLAAYETRWEDALGGARDVIRTIGKTMPTAYYLAEAFVAAGLVLVDCRSAGMAVSRHELRRIFRTARRFSRNFWNIREHTLILGGYLQK